MKPEFITFTGIDDRTDLAHAKDLAERFPIEWGVLFSASNSDPRYPCRKTIDDAIKILGKKSAHLCGRHARNAVMGSLPEQVSYGSFSRVQVNGTHLAREILHIMSVRIQAEFIVQVREEGFSFGPIHELYDCSGGKGVVPKNIPPHPGRNQLVGYAGGIGPDTVLDYLSRITGDGPFWIDMESYVRSCGWLDMSKVARVCEMVYGSA